MKWIISARVICTAAALVAVCVSCLSCSTGGISFPDPDLEFWIREDINKPTGPILQSDLDGLTTLHIYEINDLSGIEHCTNLYRLFIDDSELRDLSPLASLTNLTVLFIDYSEITDLPTISSLSQLEWLGLDSNQISDISPLSAFNSLSHLSLWENEISDISPLAGLTALDELNIRNNQITDIEALVNNAGLAAGDWVDLRFNPLSDTSINTYIPQLEARGVDVDY